uniref:Putative phage/plasmid DNA primase n=1 Tax=Coleochaete scutata TaxID=3125 RepID=A0A5P9NVW9_COLSC|nr:putative phage/plasmid DNA primase [Coleochaete scutata]QFU80109.1 putative phage/plasmid DNA primase [Coleochaete scutata]
MKFYLNVDREKFFQNNKKTEPIAPVEAAELLIKYSNLKYVKLFPSRDSYYLYDECHGYYVKLHGEDLKVYIGRILALADIVKLKSASYVTAVFSNLKVSQKSEAGHPEFSQGIIVFENGALDLAKEKFIPWSPDHFVTSYLPFPYDETASCPTFLNFIRAFCSGHEDRITFIRSFFWAVIHQRTDLQVFLHLRGPGGTGKSTLALIATALVGKEATVTTTLKSLHSDNFEITNLEGKKLILISDTEDYVGDLSVLKSATGGDSLRGRIKYVQGAIDVQIVGMVVIVSNHPLRARDTSNALIRRMRDFLAESVAESRESLISYVNGRWQGPLAEELPAIMNWSLSANPEEAISYLVRMHERVPSLTENLQEAMENINPLLLWTSEEIISGQGAFIGYQVKEGPKAEREGAMRKTLYPTYRTWCGKHGTKPLSHRRFSRELIQTLNTTGLHAELSRKTEGMYIKGVVLRDHVFERDYAYGAPIQLAASTKPAENHSVDAPKNNVPITQVVALPKPTYNPPAHNSVHLRLNPNLYDDYISKLAKTPFKLSLTKEARRLDNSLIGELTNIYCEGRKVVSDDFRASVERVITTDFIKIRDFGGIAYKYKPMGTSPRIIPATYRQSINSTKRVVRDKCYEMMGSKAKEQGMILVDLDIVSCYTAILLGLYQDHLSSLQAAIETVGLWNYIKGEFEKRGRGSVFNKPAVKICVYSSFFMGGSRAMINGILENFRKDLGLSNQEFLNSPFHEECHTIAREVTGEMMNSSIILDFREISERIKKEYLGDSLVGPTGHTYAVSEESFKSAYPNYLQSFEFALLAQTTLETMDTYPKVEIIGHYHDGNVLALPIDSKDEIIGFMLERIGQIGTDLGLRYKQKLEVKRFFS